MSCLTKLKIKTGKDQTVSSNNCIPIESSRIFTEIQKYLASNEIKFRVSGIQSKITKHAKKKQENTMHNDEKNQSTETNSEMTHDRISRQGY